MTSTGIIYDVKKYAIHDGPGIRTTVFFKGCPLSCWWCHNPESRSPQPQPAPRSRAGRYPAQTGSRCDTVGREVTVEEVLRLVMADEPFYDQSGGGVTFSGGEPLFQPEFLHALLLACRQQGLHTAVDTSGYAPVEKLLKTARDAGLILYDLKLMDDRLHRKYVGVSNELILSNLKRLAAEGLEIWIRQPLIPGITDTEENLDALADWLEENVRLRRICLLPYNLFGEEKLKRFKVESRLRPAPTQSDGELAMMADRLRSRGFEVSVGG